MITRSIHFFTVSRYAAVTAFLILVLTDIHGQVKRDGAMLVVDNTARFTVISPTCIRMEYSSVGTFENRPSIHAINRDAGWNGFTYAEIGGDVVITTGKLELRHKKGAAFSATNLTIEVNDLAKTIAYKQQASTNLTGTRRALDYFYTKVENNKFRSVDDNTFSKPSSLYRDGWTWSEDKWPLIVTTPTYGLQARPTGSVDVFFFGYGNDYRQATRKSNTHIWSSPESTLGNHFITV